MMIKTLKDKRKNKETEKQKKAYKTHRKETIIKRKRGIREIGRNKRDAKPKRKK